MSVMKIYRSDGTWYTRSLPDDFGWNLEDSDVEELDDKQNKGVNKESQKIIVKNTTNSSETNIDLFPGKNIEIQKPTSVINFDLVGEIFEDIENTTPNISRILDLINPCTVESKMLLAVVHHTMYKKFTLDMIKVEDLRRNAPVKYSRNIENTLFNLIVQCDDYKDDNFMPLLMELILADNGYDTNEFTLDNKLCTSDNFNNEVSEDQIDGATSEENKDTFFRNVENVINESIEEIRRETNRLHKRISEIEKGFQEATNRLTGLIQYAQALEKNIRATKFLDDLIYLLNGELERVVLKESPFMIFLRSQRHEVNLII